MKTNEQTKSKRLSFLSNVWNLTDISSLMTLYVTSCWFYNYYYPSYAPEFYGINYLSRWICISLLPINMQKIFRARNRIHKYNNQSGHTWNFGTKTK